MASSPFVRSHHDSPTPEQTQRYYDSSSYQKDWVTLMVSAEAYERKRSREQASIEGADEKVYARSRRVRLHCQILSPECTMGGISRTA